MTSVIVDALTTGFFTMTAWCVAGGFAITAIALLSGPYRWATAIRAAIRIGGFCARIRLGGLINEYVQVARGDDIIFGIHSPLSRPENH